MTIANAWITANIHPDTDEVRKIARVLDGPHAGAGFLLYNPGAASMGDRVSVAFEPDDQFCSIVEAQA